MHDVDDFILPVTTRFQDCTSLADRQVTADRAERNTSGPATFRDDTKFPDAVQLSEGDLKMPLDTAVMDSLCDVHTLHIPVHAATILPDIAETDRGNTILRPLRSPRWTRLAHCRRLRYWYCHATHSTYLHRPRTCACMTQHVHTVHSYWTRHGSPPILIC